MQYFLEYMKEIFIGNTPLILLCFLPLLPYLGTFAILYMIATMTATGTRFANWLIQKLGPFQKVGFALLITFVYFIFKNFLYSHIDNYTDEIKIFDDESDFFATCFGCTLLFINSLLLLYAKNIFTILQWKKWIFIPLFIVAQLITLFFASASLNWTTDFKYGDIQTTLLDDRLRSMEKYYDYEIIINKEDILIALKGPSFIKQTSINLRVYGDSICLVGQEILQELYSSKETTPSILNSKTCRWIVDEAKNEESAKNLAQSIRSYHQEYFIGWEPSSGTSTEIILLDYKKFRQKKLFFTFADERIPKATKILNAVNFYLDYWEKFKPQNVDSEQTDK